MNGFARFVTFVASFVVSSASVGVSLRADEVLVRSDDPRDAPTKLTGEVTDWTGEALILALPTGRTQTIPADQVVRVESPRTEEQKRGETLLTAGRFSEAFDALVAAEAKEPREWVKREILALSATCRLEQGDRVGAGRIAIHLLDGDPKSPHLAALPLSWQDAPPKPNEEESATKWFDGASAWGQLLAASWLLAEPKHAEAARAKFDGLSKSLEPTIATLSRLQLARRGSPEQPSPAELATLIDELPPTAKCGPYWLLAREHERAGDAAAARIAQLRCGMGFEHPRELVAAALVAAAAGVEGGERTRLLQFAVERGKETPPGLEARALLGDGS